MNNKLTKFKILLFLSNISTVIYLLWRFFFTLPFEHGVVSNIIGIGLLIIEIFGLLESLIHFKNIEMKKPYPVPEVPAEFMPDVDIFIATYNEEASLLYKTVNGCRRMDYPDKSKVHIYLCDDNRRPEIKGLAKKMGVGYFDRPDNKGAKAGNLNNALSNTTSPYIVTFDADMIPRSNFLMETIPYFVQAEMINETRLEEDQVRLGLLQTPQAFYNPDLYQFNLYSENRVPNEQDYFYKDIQAARTHTNSVIYGGSNTVISRAALEAIGGFYTEAITEDFATGLLLEKAGFVSLGTSTQLASGLSPNTLDQLVQQRVRWARGVINTGWNMNIFKSKDLSFGQKANYLASIWYWYSPIKRLIYILAPITFSVFGYTVFKCTLAELLVFWLPMALLNSYLMKSLSQNIRSVKWTSIYETAMFPFLLIPVILESFGFSLKKFKVTEKSDGRLQKKADLVYSVPFLILLFLSGIGIWNCLLIIFDSNSVAPIVGLYWLIYNSYTLIMAFFFVHGRAEDELAERIRMNHPVNISMNEDTFQGVITDCSETGIAIILKESEYAVETATAELINNKGETIVLTLKTESVLHVKEGWRFDFSILDFNNSYDAYLSHLYDRLPGLASSIKKFSGVYEDLTINFINRLKPQIFASAKQPEIKVKEKLNWSSESDSGTIFINTFGYKTLTSKNKAIKDRFNLIIDTNLVLTCSCKEIRESGEVIYQVLNIDSIINDPVQKTALRKWVHSIEHKNQLSNNLSNKKKKKIESFFDFDEMELV